MTAPMPIPPQDFQFEPEFAPLAPSIPHSREAEEAVIGAVLINPECYYDLHFLDKDDFYIHRHRWIWEAFGRLQESRTPIDMLTLSNELDKAGQLAEIGGPAYLTSLLNQVPSSLHAEHYGEIIQAASIRRKLINAANEIASMAYNDHEKSIDEIEAEANQALIKANGYHKGEGEYLDDAMGRIYTDIGENAERRKRNEPLQMGIPTGLVDIDKILQGLKPAKFIIAAGRPGMGKSTLLINIAKNAAIDHSKKVSVYSLEMTNEEIAYSILSQHSGIDGQMLESGALRDKDWPVLTNSIEALGGGNIFLDDAVNLTPAKLRTKCLKRKLAYGLDLVIIDYLQLMIPGGKFQTREAEVAYISRSIKLLSRELDIPFLVACQLNRAVEARASNKPILSDLRESGSLEQDADIVMFLHRPDQYEKDSAKQDVTEVSIAKHRKGPIGSVDLIFRPSIAKFENAATKHVVFNDSARDFTV